MKYFAYVRVSTQRQGQQGVSLEEQREAINQYAVRRGIPIARWFEERESAVRAGRPVFATMVSSLARKDGSGLIVHKIDRGARNLKDWAALGELIDQGVDVRFVQDDLALDTRGGRLAADIQAVIAADYVRNLREEVRKGFYGRLKQGLYPLQAPIGYVDRGGGRVKALDPRTAPLIADSFLLFATGEYSIRHLRTLLYERGLRNGTGRMLSPTAMGNLLRNPFYAGTIRIQTTREEYRGAHRPIVSQELFASVQAVLKARSSVRSRHLPSRFPYTQLIRCCCGWHLVGELQKGHTYYRCHHGCPRVCVREESIDAAVFEQFGSNVPIGTWNTRKRELLQFAKCEIRCNGKVISIAQKSSNTLGVRPKKEQNGTFTT